MNLSPLLSPPTEMPLCPLQTGSLMTCCKHLSHIGYLILITNDSHQCYSMILRLLVSIVREINYGVRRKNSDTAQYLVYPPFAAKTARQRRLMLQMLQISFLMTCNGILTHSACKARSRSRMLLISWRSLT